MNKLTILLFFLICFSSFGQNQKNKLIEFNGLYKTKCQYEKNDNDGTQGYLRFYNSGKVISVSTECEATALDLKDWFNLEMKYVSVGDYQLNGKRIRFLTTNRNGTVKYKGKINKRGLLKLKSKSLINGHKSRKEYSFVKVNGLK